jgi:phosphate transport system substrate-binding protein
MMKSSRGLWLVLLALVATVTGTFAQEEPLTVVGSNIAASILQAVAPETLPLQINAQGMAAGSEAFCSNTAQILAASRPLTQAEADLCQLNNVQFQQYTLANYYLAVVVNAADPVPACLSISELNLLLQPSAAGRVINWSSISEELDLPLTIYLPASGTLDYAILDGVINGVGLRADALTDAPAALSEAPGSLGVFPVTILQEASDLRIVPIRFVEPDGECLSPDMPTLDNDAYKLSTLYRVFINTTAAEAAAPLIEALVDPQNAAEIALAGFVPPSTEQYELNRLVSLGEVVAVDTDSAAPLYVIPPGLAGQVVGGGQALLSAWLQSASTQLTSAEQNLRVTLTFDGEAAGMRRFCNGELDFIVASGPLTGDAAANCQASGIVPYEIALGRKPIVLLANAADDYAACLTTTQLDRIWRIPSESPVNDWSQVDSAFPEEPLTLFSPTDGSQADILLRRGAAPVLPMRDDTITNADPLFRAAAVANVPGSLTFMLWDDYQRVLANEQPRIQLVAVDADQGCVLPNETTIADGSYPLSVSVSLLIAREKLADTNVRAYLWTLFSDASEASFQLTGFVNDANFFNSTRSALAQSI